MFRITAGIGRRQALGIAFGPAVATLMGCDGVTLMRTPGVCTSPSASGIVVDMHCHIMNLQDADDAAFVVRHLVDGDEKGAVLDGVAGAITALAALPNRLVTMTGNAEYQWLRRITEQVQRSPQAFCDEAAKNQHGTIFAGEDHHDLGFASNRARSAALLMSRFPRVDIFTPSMVDFHEGGNPYSHPSELVDFYSQLNVATLGRFLPLVSFNPSRAWSERTTKPANHYLNLIHDCVESKGFVGVKLHPSTGFAPIDNERYGCPNSARQHERSILPEQAAFYDNVLRDLFIYCRNAEIPILVHSGEGIPANRACMTDPNLAHTERPNAPALWERAIHAANNATGSDFRGTALHRDRSLTVCFAHLAGGFNTVKGRLHPHPWLQSMDGIIARNRRIYVDLADQVDMFDQRRTTKEGPLVVSEPHRITFQAFLEHNRYLAEHLMYGSDWHMPSVARIGRRYLDGIEALLPKRYRTNTMGRNAVEFFGLTRGTATRKRLDKFYRDRGILDRVAWMRKIDADV